MENNTSVIRVWQRPNSWKPIGLKNSPATHTFILESSHTEISNLHNIFQWQKTCATEL